MLKKHEPLAIISEDSYSANILFYIPEARVVQAEHGAYQNFIHHAVRDQDYCATVRRYCLVDYTHRPLPDFRQAFTAGEFDPVRLFLPFVIEGFVFFFDLIGFQPLPFPVVDIYQSRSHCYFNLMTTGDSLGCL